MLKQVQSFSPSVTQTPDGIKHVYFHISEARGGVVCAAVRGAAAAEDAAVAREERRGRCISYSHPLQIRVFCF